MDTEWSMDTSLSGFSVEEAAQAAKELFSESNASFEEIKNRPWYRSLLNTVTLHQGDKKLVVRHIRTLASLQSLFMEVYITQLHTLDAELDAIVQGIRSTQEAVNQLYCTCVLNLNPQKDIASLTEEDQQLLLLLLSEFNQTRCLAEPERERLQEYNSAVAQALYLKRPNGSLEPEKLEKVQDPAALYRCVLEQCAVTGRLEPLDLPENVEEAVDYLDISNKKKRETQSAVQTELDDYGKNWFFQKYSKQGSILDERDFVFAEDEPEELPEADGTTGDKEEPDDPIELLTEVIDLFTSNNRLGEPQAAAKTPEKNRLIARLLPGVLPVSKTVLEITKLQNGYLVFTTCSLYWVVKDQVCRIPYAGVDQNCIGTKTAGKNTAFVFDSASGPQVEIADSNLDAASLENLLMLISEIQGLPEKDTLTEFSELPLEIRFAYMKILAGIIGENGLSLHNVFRIAARRDMATHWKEICEEPETTIDELIRNFTARIPYPNEEALTISLLQDLCTAYQYTKDSDVLTAEEKKYFSLIHSAQDSSISSIISYAQMEKQMIEGRINTEKVKETSDAFSIAAGAVGASVLTYAGAWSLFMSTLWFNFIPGIGTLLSAGIAGAAIASKYLSSKRDTSVSDAQARQEMKEKLIASYRQSEWSAQNLGFDELSARLREEALKLAERIDIRYADYTDAEQELLQEIRQEIVTYMQADQKRCAEKKLNLNSKLIKDLPRESWETVLENLTFSNSNVNFEDIVGLYDPTFSGAVFGNFMGLLFLQSSICYRKNKSSPIQQIDYLDMTAMDEKFVNTIIHGRNGNTITLNSINYIDITNLLRRIIKMVNEKT